MRVVTVKEMAEIEKITKDEFHFDDKLVIENVGISAASYLDKIFNEKEIDDEIVFLIGKGKNGADALATARHLSNKGHRCRAFILFSESECKAEVHLQSQMAQSYGVSINFIENIDQVTGYFDQIGPAIIVDGLFGTGVQLPLSQFMYDVIDYINQNSLFVVSIDIPSGVQGDTGFIQGNAIEADLTLAIGYPKVGHYISDGSKHCGDIKTIKVGIPRQFDFKGNKFLLRPEHMVDLLNPRDKFADKKYFGHSLVLGGSHGLTGAPALSSHASLRVGSGLVTAATWEPQYQELIQRLPAEVMYGYVPLDFNKWGRLIQDLDKYSSIVIGPGLARSSRSRRLVLEILNNFDGPVVIDADAINVLKFKEDKEVFSIRNAPTVLTPHLGEFSKFSDVSFEKITREPLKYLQELIENINCTVVLKGPCTYLGCSDGNIFFNYSPNDGMASGGSGDVLAGILGGLLGQETSLKEKTSLVSRYETFNRIVAQSVYIHSQAGKLAAESLGVRAMSAKSIIDYLPKAFSALDEKILKMYREY